MPSMTATSEGEGVCRPDRLQGFFKRPIFLSLTIGIPFCIFKLLFGSVAFRVGFGAMPSAVAPIVWSIVCPLNIGVALVASYHVATK